MPIIKKHNIAKQPQTLSLRGFAPVAHSKAERLSRPLSIECSIYDAAETNVYNRNRWLRATGDAAADANDPKVRKIIRNRARYEVANNAYARAITLNLGNDLVGVGPRLQVGDDGADAETVEYAWQRWCDRVGLYAILRQMRTTRAEDGEVFLLLATADADADGATLYPVLIPADRVASFAPSTATSLDGIEFDAIGRPTQYRVLSPGARSDLESKTYPASVMIHYASIQRPGQVRGISELAPALEMFRTLRDFTANTLLAAEHAASYGGIVTTNLAAPAGAEELTEIDATPNSFTVLPAGWDIKQLDARHPTTEYAAFKREILSEIFRCVNMPYNVAAADSSGHNYSLGKLDDQAYRRQIVIDQSVQSSLILDRLFAAWYEQVFGGVETPSHVWYWPRREYLDAAKESQAAAKRLETGVSTLEAECAALGFDYKEVIRQRGIEQKMMEAEGLVAASIPDQEEASEEKN